MLKLVLPIAVALLLLGASAVVAAPQPLEQPSEAVVDNDLLQVDTEADSEDGLENEADDEKRDDKIESDDDEDDSLDSDGGAFIQNFLFCKRLSVNIKYFLFAATGSFDLEDTEGIPGWRNYGNFCGPGYVSR